MVKTQVNLTNTLGSVKRTQSWKFLGILEFWSWFSANSACSSIRISCYHFYYLGYKFVCLCKVW